MAATLLAVNAPAATPEPVQVTVAVGTPGARLNPAMWGIFFEDINLGADGGLASELVKNGSFEFTQFTMGWAFSGGGSHAVRMVKPLHPNNPNYLEVTTDPTRPPKLANEGHRGMGVRKGETYTFSVFARAAAEVPVTLQITVLGQGGQVLGKATLGRFTGEWLRHSVPVRINATEAKARLLVTVEGGGKLDLDMVSLQPVKTWKNRPQGLRADLVQMLADLQPGFMRFPGGCIVEGHVLANRYQWKTTIGNPEERKLIINRWNDEFKHRPAPDYFQSFAVGFLEYFQVCEDMGAEPLPIINCGMACQFNSNELAPLDKLDPYLQDMLDLIEFANGDASTPWGARRVALGHPAPFRLKLLGVGNEQWGPQYIERLARLAPVLKARHPEIQLISSAGPDPDGDKFNFLWPKLRELKADLVDEHYYRPPAWFLDNTRRYDAYDRQGPKIFAGEYAAQSVRTVSPDNRNNWECALAEAAMLTGFERNGDVVRMSSYAPLFGHVDGWQWRPNLIWFDNLTVFGTPNYYVQQLFSRNRGDVILPVTVAGAPTAANREPRFYASSTREEKTSEIIVKLVNATAQSVSARLDLQGAGKLGGKATATLLTTAKLTDENTLEEPRKVAPVTTRLGKVAAAFTQECPAYSVTVLRVPQAK